MSEKENVMKERKKNKRCRTWEKKRKRYQIENNGIKRKRIYKNSLKVMFSVFMFV